MWKKFDPTDTSNVYKKKLFWNPKIPKLPPLSKGALQVSREPQNIIDAGQTIHGIYRNGKVRFWMKPKPPSPSLLQGFENYICVKAGKLGKLYMIPVLVKNLGTQNLKNQ